MEKNKTINYLNQYKYYLLSCIFFIIISNLQINILENRFNTLYNGIESIKVIGTVISDKKDTTYKSSYTIKVESVNLSKKFKGTNLIIYVSKSKKIQYGDKVEISGIFEKAKTARNYMEFDYREYLKSKNIYGMVNCDTVNVLESNNLCKISIMINKLRNSIKSNLKDISNDKADFLMRNITSGIHQI